MIILQGRTSSRTSSYRTSSPPPRLSLYSALGLPKSVACCAKVVARGLAKSQGGHTSSIPPLCASALYIIAALTRDTQRTRAEVAEAGGVTEGLLGKTIKQLLLLEDLVPLSYLEALIEAGRSIQAVE
jgi:hypothetical protein